MIVKVCKKHGSLINEQVYQEKSKQYKCGFQLRCRQCKLDKDARWREANLEIHRASSGTARAKARKEFREGKTNVEPKANIAARLDRKENPEKHREWSRRVREKLGSFRNVMEISRVRGISTEKYQIILDSQDNKCAICNNHETKKNRSGDIARLCLDHNHETNQVRQFLCHSCNLMIGHFNESPEIMISAISYLKKHGESCK